MAEERKILDDWSAEIFVGNNYEYYKNKWRDKPERQEFASWNWSAFLFPVYWLAYRKMYLEAFLYELISLFAMIIPGSGLVLHIVVGIYANSYYRKKGLRIILPTSGITDGEAGVYINKHGGTSVLGLFIAIVINVFIVISVVVGIAFFPTGEKEIHSQAVQSETGDLRVASEKNKEVVTRNGEIVYTVPDSFVEGDSRALDLNYTSMTGDLGFGVCIFEPEDLSEDITEKSLLDYYIGEVKKNEEILLLTDVQLPQLGGNVVQEMFFSNNGIKIYWHFSCQKVGDHYAVTLISVSPSKWNKTRDLCSDIILSARLAKEN